MKPRRLTENEDIMIRHNYQLPVSGQCGLGMSEVAERRADARKASDKMLRALLSYGVKHGLPNISPVECKQRLRAL